MQKNDSDLIKNVSGAHVLIVCAPYYEKIAEAQLTGVKNVLDAHSVSYDIDDVPGALEIPAAIQFAAEASEDQKIQKPFDAYIALGCIIRGETYHFEIVANESARGLMDLTIQMGLCIGNGILTVENRAQAMERAMIDKRDKGGETARVALEMLSLKRKYGLAS